MKAKAKPKAKPKAQAKPKSKARPRAKAKPRAKTYRLADSELRPIAPGHGACIATDKITVDGQPVRFMYREQAIHEADSGWRFLAGIESDAYMDDPSNHGFYDCNTIANFDPTIVPHLDAPIGSVFEKPPGAAEFLPVTDWTPGA
ncbi:MAG TPA: DUF2185 domain-containing protein [Kofleriaceae bacterium]|nr:DUF2185 domain-containing protein [Kofleriaceae bacterium]